MKANVILQFDQIPPCLCRILARTGESITPIAVIAKRAKMTQFMTREISRLPSWETVTVGDAVRFSEACGVDLLRPRPRLFYLKRVLKSGGLKTLARGTTMEYIINQIQIRHRYEKALLKTPGPAGR